MTNTKAQQIATCYDLHVLASDYDWTQEFDRDLEEAEMWADHEQTAVDFYREYYEGDWFPEAVERFLRNDGVADWREDRA